MHGYVPYHTQEYLARQALNRKEMKERVAQGASKAVSNKSPPQQVLPDASSSVPPPAPKLPEVAYYDDFWKIPTDITHSSPQPLPSQDVPLSLPFEMWPGYDTANAIQNFPSTAQSLPSLTPSDLTVDYYSDLLGPQFYTTQPQGLQFGESLTGDHSMPPYYGNGQWNWPQ